MYEGSVGLFTFEMLDCDWKPSYARTVIDTKPSLHPEGVIL
jgi:hypothetical protein